MIDLHTHSTASDGTLTPTMLVKAAADLGLTAVALTDHDTVSGLAEFLGTVTVPAIQTVAGVEIACSWYGASLHFLGLFINWHNPTLTDLLARIRDARIRRNRQMLEQLQAIGIDLDYDTLAASVGGEVIGRPHVAAALVGKGLCASIQDAFSQYIGKDCPGYVRRFLPMPEEGIAAIHAAGGVAVWAHPMGQATVTRPAAVRKLGRHLVALGIDAVEVHYSDYLPEHEKIARDMAAELGLLASGGSDFHGDNIADISLGRGRGNLTVPDELLPALAERAQTYR